MKKTGFTLAELLISLGIIGVIAALTLPSLNRNTVEAQIGPKLAKAASSFEQANTALLNDEGVDALTDTNNVITTPVRYMQVLGNHVKGAVNGPTITTKDGISYAIQGNINQNASTINPHRVTVATLMIDINGANRPNQNAEDRFFFNINNDGSLTPLGSTNGPANDRYTVRCPNGQIPSAANAAFCTASIFEQNLRVMYR